jgi:hypothetical protein
MTTRKLHISDDLSLPLDAATQTIAIVARKGAGKSYAAGKLAEELLEHDVQVVVMDTVGNWYGLRIGADGKSKGYDIPVLGGLRGDVPLTPESGALIADLVVDTGQSFILDLSQFSLSARKKFAHAFGEQLWKRKKGEADPTPVHVVLEECQLIIPQFVGRDDARMVGIWEEIVRLGRNYGIGVTMITQRPQSVNKEVLTQTECLLVLQVNGVPERKALKEWIVHQGASVDLLNELPSLPVGTAYLWSPQWLRVFEKIRIAKKRTFDASATPKVGERRVKVELKPLDLVELRAKMEAVTKTAEANDPTALHRRIRELERDIRKGPEPAKPVVKEVPIVTESDHRTLKELFEGTRADFDKAAAKLEALGSVFRELGTQVAKPAQRPPAPPRSFTPPTRPARPQPARFDDGPVTIKKGAREMLAALAVRHPTPLTRAQIGTLAGLSSTSGTFSDYLSSLRRAGYIEERGHQVVITDAGLAFLGPNRPRAPQTTDELVTLWRNRFKKGARAMLDKLVEQYPRGLTREELGTAVEMSHSSGTFSDYLSSLRRAGLLDESDGAVRASPDLFMDGAA